MSLLSTAGSFLLGLKRTVYLLRLSSQEAKVFQQQVEQTPPCQDKVLERWFTQAAILQVSKEYVKNMVIPNSARLDLLKDAEWA